MDIIRTIAPIREKVKRWRAQGLSVGLVPTMGFLHEGHQSLIAEAVKHNDRVVVSVFVNPKQFGPAEDLATYPRDLEKDAALCKTTGADVIFHPEPAEMYPEGFCSFADVEELGTVLCGQSRPIHFRGVCTVIVKLFHIIQPDRMYFGQKDAQQLTIVRRLARDLNMPVEIVGCPIVRETDGLAQSSRNAYLRPEERQAATVLSRAVAAGRTLAEKGETRAVELRAAMEKVLAEEPLANVEYVAIVDAQTLRPVDQIGGPILAALAVRIGKTRLIDNFQFPS